MSDKFMRKNVSYIIDVDDSAQKLPNPTWNALCEALYHIAEEYRQRSNSTWGTTAYISDRPLIGVIRTKAFLVRSEINAPLVGDLRKEIQRELSSLVQPGTEITVAVEVSGKDKSTYIVTKGQDTTWEKFIGLEG